VWVGAGVMGGAVGVGSIAKKCEQSRRTIGVGVGGGSGVGGGWGMKTYVVGWGLRGSRPGE